MIKFAVILLALLTFFAPIVAALLIADNNKKAIVPMLAGGGLFTLLEAGIILPVINFLGYSIFFNILGIVIIEVLRWLVLGIYLKKTGFKSESIKNFFAGYALVNVFIVWGIDAISTAIVMLFSDFGLLSAGEIWISLLLAIVKVVMLYSYTVFAATAVIQRKPWYIAAAIGLHVITDDSIILSLCNVLDISEGTGVVFLVVAVACIMPIVNGKMSGLWKGKENEK